MDASLVHTKKDIKALNNMELIVNFELVTTEMTKSVNFQGKVSKATQRKYDYLIKELSNRLDFSADEYNKVIW